MRIVRMKEVESIIEALVNDILSTNTLTPQTMKTKILIHFNMMNKELMGQSLSDLEKEKSLLLAELNKEQPLKGMDRVLLERKLTGVNIQIKKINVFLTNSKDINEYQMLKEAIKTKHGLEELLDLTKEIY